MTDDLSAILREIDELAGVPTICDTDVTIEALQEMWHGISDSTVIARMRRLVDSGAFEAMKVYDPAIGRTRRVWRKVQQGDSSAGE